MAAKCSFSIFSLVKSHLAMTFLSNTHLILQVKAHILWKFQQLVPHTPMWHLPPASYSVWHCIQGIEDNFSLQVLKIVFTPHQNGWHGWTLRLYINTAVHVHQDAVWRWICWKKGLVENVKVSNVYPSCRVSTGAKSSSITTDRRTFQQDLWTPRNHSIDEDGLISLSCTAATVALVKTKT